MKHLTVLLSFVLALTFIQSGCVSGTSKAPPPGPPPTAIVETSGPPPFAGAVWVNGFWVWHGHDRRWEWRRGFWG